MQQTPSIVMAGQLLHCMQYTKLSLCMINEPYDAATLWMFKKTMYACRASSQCLVTWILVEYNHGSHACSYTTKFCQVLQLYSYNSACDCIDDTKQLFPWWLWVIQLHYATRQYLLLDMQANGVIIYHFLRHKLAIAQWGCTLLISTCDVENDKRRPMG